jgi:hypothetical protein
LRAERELSISQLVRPIAWRLDPDPPPSTAAPVVKLFSSARYVEEVFW